MLLKVMLILSMISAATCLAWLFPQHEQMPDDDDWEEAPRSRDMDHRKRGPATRLPP
jgi:hypothetical protein